MTPAEREGHRAQLTLRREQLRNLLEELAELRREGGLLADVAEDAGHAARRLFEELGAVRDNLSSTGHR